jgi:hypothetical protein
MTIRTFSTLAVGALIASLLVPNPSRAAAPFPALRFNLPPPAMMTPARPLITPLPNSASMINPALQITPGVSLSQAAFNVHMFRHELRRILPFLSAYNPYRSSMATYGYPMAMGRGYGSPAMMVSNGYGSAASSAYNAPSSNPAGNPARNAQAAQGSYGTVSTTRTEGSSNKAGVFAGLTKPEGGVDWPLALRILPPGFETKDLRQRIDDRVAQLQVQAADGKVDAGLLKEANGDLDRLQRLLAEKGEFMSLPQEATTKAKDFVRSLRSALASLQ